MQNNGKPPSRTDRMRELADYVEGLEDEDSEVTETQIIVQPGATVTVDQTGRFAAVEPTTKRDNPRPPPGSEPPPSTKQKFFLAVLDRVPAAWRGPIVLVALGILGIIVWRGGAGAGWWR